MALRKLFTEADLKRIEESVASAEGLTSGEIVPCVVRRSGRYPIAAWRAAMIGGGLGWGLSFEFGHWGDSAIWIAVGAAVGFCLGRFIPLLERVLSLRSELAQQVREKAIDAFVEHEVFATTDRCGVLIYVSLFEHQVVVLADSGIHQKVSAGTWDSVCRAVTQATDLAEGIIAAIALCSRTLVDLGFKTKTQAQKNQLSNTLRTASGDSEQ